MPAPIPAASTEQLTIFVKHYDDDPDVNLFCVYANAAATMMFEAGRFLLDRQSKDPTFRDRVKAACSGFTDATLDTFIHVGLREWHPSVVLQKDSPGKRRLIKQPYSIQEAWGNKPIDILCTSGEMLPLPLNALTKDQADQAFGKDGPRKLKVEQQAYLEWRKSKEAQNPKIAKPFVIQGNKVKFSKGTVLSKEVLQEILNSLD